MSERTASRLGSPQSRPGTPRRVQAGPSPHAFTDLGAVLTAPCCARAWAREILREWGVSELADSAELVASELVTNAVNACLGMDRAAIGLVITLDRAELTILVRDGHPGVPVAARPGAEDENGRGLQIVERLSDRWGWYRLEVGKPVKVTWAVISGSGHADGQHILAGRPGASPPAGRRPVLPLPARRCLTPLRLAGMRSSRPPDLAILARVKAALERF